VSDRTGALPRSGLWGGGAFLIVFLIGWVAFGYAWTHPRTRRTTTVGGIRIDPSFFALFFALVIYTASHIAEIVRGSIQAVPRGQGEAADAVALSGFQRMWYVILPQAFRIAIPPIGNQYLNLIKNSSLGAAIGYYDITLVAQTTVGNGSPAVPVFALTMVLYIFISLITSVFVNIANRRSALVER
jgi:general L-amino acid transport system permease protein